MKCPACQASHRRKVGPKCSKCGREFVFFAKGSDITDQRFTQIIERASASGTQYFTINQLATQLAQKSNASSRYTNLVVGMVLVVGGLVVAFGKNSNPEGGTLAVVVGLGFVVWWVWRRISPLAPPVENVAGWVRAWTQAGHEIPMLLTRPALEPAPPEFPEPDLFDYGVERILIVQHDLLVDLFVRNGLHTKERALVISESGYPKYLLEHAQKLLRESPELPVFLLHDADPPGLLMRERIERAGLLPVEGHPVIDTGLSPHEVSKIKKLRPLVPKRHGFALPADALPYGLLAGGFALAFSERLPLAQLVDRQDPDQASSFG